MFAVGVNNVHGVVLGRSAAAPPGRGLLLNRVLSAEVQIGTLRRPGVWLWEREQPSPSLSVGAVDDVIGIAITEELTKIEQFKM